MKVRRICKWCGKEFYVIPSVAKNGRGTFCSRECASKWRSKNLIGDKNPTYNKAKLNCKYCGKPFFVPQSRVETAKYCSRDCKNKWQSDHLSGENSVHYKERIKTTCSFCGKDIYVRTSLIAKEFGNFCSTECAGKWRSEHLCGGNNANWQNKITKMVCKCCGKEFYVKESILKRGRGKFCSKECYDKWQSENLSGENSPAWQGGLSFFPYCSKFNEAFKERIRDKFGRVCFLCGKTEEENSQKLSVHHVNYSKDCLCDDDKSCQFVPLCASGHGKTNFNREYWQEYIMAKLRSRIDGYFI